jgi:hypothetical protein
MYHLSIYRHQPNFASTNFYQPRHVTHGLRWRLLPQLCSRQIWFRQQAMAANA